MTVRDLEWSDFQGSVDLYYTRYEEVDSNPELGILLYATRPSVSEEAVTFGKLMKAVLSHDAVASVAEESGTVVGNCTIHRTGHHLEDSHVASLGIAVHPSFRRRGLGDALLKHALKKCEGLFEIVDLRVFAVNHPAMALYRKHGFHEYGRQPQSFKRGDRYLDDILMWRPVGAKP
jgi:ribosomal protein S18 acetylase RimI-like enzyme